LILIILLIYEKLFSKNVPQIAKNFVKYNQDTSVQSKYMETKS